MRGSPRKGIAPHDCHLYDCHILLPSRPQGQHSIQICSDLHRSPPSPCWCARGRLQLWRRGLVEVDSKSYRGGENGVVLKAPLCEVVSVLVPKASTSHPAGMLTGTGTGTGTGTKAPSQTHRARTPDNPAARNTHTHTHTHKHTHTHNVREIRSLGAA